MDRLLYRSITMEQVSYHGHMPAIWRHEIRANLWMAERATRCSIVFRRVVYAFNTEY